MVSFIGYEHILAGRPDSPGRSLAPVHAAPYGAGSVLVAVAFALSTYERGWVRRRRHDLAWTAALALFAAGALALFFAIVTGWSSLSFRLFYLLGGVLTVPVLALGTIYLLGGRRIGDRASLGVALIGAFAAGVVLTAPLRVPLEPHRLNEGRIIFGLGPRLLAAIGSGLGALVVIGGALWSVFGLLRSGHRLGRATSANLLIALGTLLISFKRPFVALSGSDETGLALALCLGLAAMFAGFILASLGPRAAPHIVAAQEARSSRRTILPTTPSGS